MKNKTKEIITVPVYGHRVIIKQDAYNGWMCTLVQHLVDTNKIDPSKYEKLEGTDLPYVPLADILKACKIDSKLELMILEMECFREYVDREDNDYYVLWIDDKVFDDTLSNIEKKNIIVNMFHELGLPEVENNDYIETFLDIIDIEEG